MSDLLTVFLFVVIWAVNSALMGLTTMFAMTTTHHHGENDTVFIVLAIMNGLILTILFFLAGWL